MIQRTGQQQTRSRAFRWPDRSVTHGLNALPCLRGLTEIGSESFKLAVPKDQGIQAISGWRYAIIAPDDDRLCVVKEIFRDNPYSQGAMHY
jgi:hypothetical protein